MSSALFIESQPPYTHLFSIRYDTVKQRTPAFGGYGEEAEGFVTINPSRMADIGTVLCAGEMRWRGYQCGFTCFHHPLRNNYGSFKDYNMNDVMRGDINMEYFGDPEWNDKPFSLKRLEIPDENGHEFLKLIVSYGDGSAGNTPAPSEDHGGNLILWLKRRQGEQVMQLTDDERSQLRGLDKDFNKAEQPPTNG